MHNGTPNETGRVDCGVFGLEDAGSQADLVILPCPWDVTTSYRSGARLGPNAILSASPQLDLMHPWFPEFWRRSFSTDLSLSAYESRSQYLGRLARAVMDRLELGAELAELELRSQQEINEGCSAFIETVRDRVRAHIGSGRKTILLGGDHSVTEGAVAAFSSDEFPSFGLLQIDAHMDLRDTYQGFTHSHASVMRRCLGYDGVESLTQVGIRDYCEEEWLFSRQKNGRVITFLDTDIQSKLMNGASWKHCCDDIVSQLPEQIYLTVDIDSLSPEWCPNTGTPVPGGLTYSQLIFLIREVVLSGRKIIGADLVEVNPGPHVDSLDGIVGARILYFLAGFLGEIS